jgi:molybdopterin molybdotransferase
MPVAQGAGVNRRGQEIRTGSTILDGSRAIEAQDLGLLASLGLAQVSIVRRPRIALIVVPKKHACSGCAQDGNGPMLRALVTRDGGLVETVEKRSNTIGALALALADAKADLILVAGRTGTGPDDIAPLALAAAGTLDIHGIALRPGGSSGMGHVSSTPVILLPGNPLAAFCVYDMFAGRLIRKLAGRAPHLPYPVRNVWLTRKIVSEVGQVDLCRVRVSGHTAEPLGTAESGGLASVVRADGFVMVPAALEGFASGAHVPVHLYNRATGGK